MRQKSTNSTNEEDRADWLTVVVPVHSQTSWVTHDTLSNSRRSSWLLMNKRLEDTRRGKLYSTANPKKRMQQSDLISLKDRYNSHKGKMWANQLQLDPIPPRLAFQLRTNPENPPTMAVRGTKMVQQQIISTNKLFNCILRWQRGPSDGCLGLLLARWNQIFAHHVLGHSLTLPFD
jgi:hypothetical protein